MAFEPLLKKLWKQYIQEIPAAKQIHQLFEARDEKVGYLDHDHIALRTFDDPRVNIEVIIKPFVDAGYTPSMTYDFPSKHLFARHYEPPYKGAPKVFISELLTKKFSSEFQTIIKQTIDNIPNDLLADTTTIFARKTPWDKLVFSVYKQLFNESQYGAWVYAYGFRANHFAIAVNSLKTFESCAQINAFLKKEGYLMNQENGEVKGSPEALLEQSSIMAEQASVHFSDGPHKIPSCYYEFTQRFAQADRELYPGFIAASADKLFESTDIK
jgi:hypothetical protein